MTLTDFSARTNRANLSGARHLGKQIPCLVMTEARKEGRREGSGKVASKRGAAGRPSLFRN